MELARRRVASTIQRMDRIFRSVRSRIAQHQEKRKERIIPRGLPFEIGLLVRRKLQPVERRLGKRSSYKSPRNEKTGRYLLVPTVGDKEPTNYTETL